MVEQQPTLVEVEDENEVVLTAMLTALKILFFPFTLTDISVTFLQFSHVLSEDSSLNK